MQIIRPMPVSLEVYADTDYQRQVEPSAECPNCCTRDSLEPLGYYSRGITSTGRDVLRILIRRFRCTTCFRTVSVLPSFAHPYRLVASATVSQFFSGTIAAVNARWVPLLAQYEIRVGRWLPSISGILRSLVAVLPQTMTFHGWWTSLRAGLGELDRITQTLVARFQVTLFGRYRCHALLPPHNLVIRKEFDGWNAQGANETGP